ncbi:MAG TPA: diguanylate cyclase [Chthonomonadaceae bacterium]|nr:diguanylate cyclase [Chthonomonadaceae bacterium]
MWENIREGVTAWGKALAERDSVATRDSAWFRLVAQGRLAVWLVVLLATCLFFHRYIPASVEVAALGSLLSMAVLFRSLWPGREISRSKIDAFLTDDLVGAVAAGADLLLGVLMIHACGSFRSPFLLLLPAGVVEGYALFGTFGAAALCLLSVTALLFRFHPAAAVGTGLLTTASLLEWTRSRISLPAFLTAAPKVEDTEPDETSFEPSASTPSPDSAAQQGIKLLMSFPPIGSAAPIKARPLAAEAPEPASSLEEAEADSQPAPMEADLQEVASYPTPSVEDAGAWAPPATPAERPSIERAVEQLLETVVALDGEADARDLYARILSVVLDLLEADSGALWLEDGHKLTVQAAERSVAVPLSAEPLPVWPVETLRERCVKQLRLAAAFHSPPIVVLLPRMAGSQAAGEDIVGVVGVCAPRGRATFSAEDGERLQALAASIAATLRSVEQRVHLQQRVRETSLLYEINRRLQDLNEVEQIGPVVVAHTQRVLGSEDSTLFLMDPEGKYIEAKATEGRLINLVDYLTFPSWPGISGWIADGAQPLFLPDLERERGLMNAEAILPFVRSFLAAPLRAQGRLIGMLTASHTEPGAFTADDLRLLTLLAEQAAGSIERTEAFQTLETLALTDELTQVYNHRYFLVRLEDELRRGERHETAATIMMVDLDNFKEINDRFGHIHGDRILHDLAALLRQCVRASEIVTRYGGDEFALILPSTEYESAQLVAERLRSAVAGHTFQTVDGRSVHLTLSIGLASYPQHGLTRADLVAHADRALYIAKSNGGNQVGPEAPPRPAPAVVADDSDDSDFPSESEDLRGAVTPFDSWSAAA